MGRGGEGEEKGVVGVGRRGAVGKGKVGAEMVERVEEEGKGRAKEAVGVEGGLELGEKEDVRGREGEARGQEGLEREGEKEGEEGEIVVRRREGEEMWMGRGAGEEGTEGAARGVEGGETVSVAVGWAWVAAGRVCAEEAKARAATGQTPGPWL